LVAYEFLGSDPFIYLSKAFEFSRQFFFKWTVNWRFIGEETFLSKPFSLGLLGAHAGLLLLFLETRWLRLTNVGLSGLEDMLLSPPNPTEQAQILKRIRPDFVLTIMLSAMAIGCLCARSLHYQFFAYIAWTTPYLLWKSGLHPVLVYAIWAAQEWAWNVYPSTDASSMVVVGCLAATVAASWFALGNTLAVKQAHQKDVHVE
jgi:alpha-1,3-mannosyltransferase